jgi:uncharacterized protein YmfQ (DUF2313 family)
VKRLAGDAAIRVIEQRAIRYCLSSATSALDCQQKRIKWPITLQARRAETKRPPVV